MSAGDANNDFFVYWAARIMAGKLGVSCSDSGAINSAFKSAMSLGVARAHRTLLPVCSKYAPQSADQADVRAAGYRSPNGLVVARNGEKTFFSTAAAPKREPRPRLNYA